MRGAGLAGYRFIIGRGRLSGRRCLKSVDLDRETAFNQTAAGLVVDLDPQSNATTGLAVYQDLGIKGVTANIAFEPNGELKNPAMTLYVYKDGKKTPL